MPLEKGSVNTKQMKGKGGAQVSARLEGEVEGT